MWGIQFDWSMLGWNNIIDTLSGLLMLPSLIWAILMMAIPLQTDVKLAKVNEIPGYFRKKVAWITGASSGIGEQFARELAKRGCMLIITSRSIDRLEMLKNSIINQGLLSNDQIEIIACDLSQIESIDNVVEKAMAFKGYIDILINNAGIVMQANYASFHVNNAIIQLDLLAPIKLTSLVLPHMQKKRNGHLLFVNSILGRFVSPSRGGYSAAKAGLRLYAETLEIELRCGKYDNIYVHTLIPGRVDTDCGAKALDPWGNPMNAVTKRGSSNSVTAQQVAVAGIGMMCGKLSEGWIAKNPDLFYLYLSYYTPAVFNGLYPVVAKQKFDEANQLATSKIQKKI